MKYKLYDFIELILLKDIKELESQSGDLTLDNYREFIPATVAVLRDLQDYDLELPECINRKSLLNELRTIDEKILKAIIGNIYVDYIQSK